MIRLFLVLVLLTSLNIGFACSIRVPDFSPSSNRFSVYFMHAMPLHSNLSFYFGFPVASFGSFSGGMPNGFLFDPFAGLHLYSGKPDSKLSFFTGGYGKIWKDSRFRTDVKSPVSGLMIAAYG